MKTPLNIVGKHTLFVVREIPIKRPLEKIEVQGSFSEG
jgi:hypothetical protein